MSNNNMKTEKSTADICRQKIEEFFMKNGLKLVHKDDRVGQTNVTMYPKPSKEQESLNKSANINKKSEKL